MFSPCCPWSPWGVPSLPVLPVRPCAWSLGTVLFCPSRKATEQFNKLLYPGEKEPRAWAWDTVGRGISLSGEGTVPSPRLSW